MARVVVARGNALFLRAPEGNEQRLVETPRNTFPFFPVWSPDGTTIAYAQWQPFNGQADADWGSDIYLIEVATGAVQLAWHHDQPGAVVQGLAWLPDGGGLLLGYSFSVIRDGRYQGRVQRVERLALAGGQRTTVVEGAILPTIARNGARMAYVTEDDNGKVGIWVAALDGTGAKQIVELGAQFEAFSHPVIAPDGRTLVFGAADTGSGSAPPASTRGGVLRALIRRLLPHAASAHGPRMDLWTVSVATGTLTRITTFGEDAPYAAWSPDGALLTAIATGGLYELRPDGSELRKVGDGAHDGQLDVK